MAGLDIVPGASGYVKDFLFSLSNHIYKTPGGSRDRFRIARTDPKVFGDLYDTHPFPRVIVLRYNCFWLSLVDKTFALPIVARIVQRNVMHQELFLTPTR
jgi:hypothetical protein